MKKVFTRILMSSFYGILIQISLGNLLLASTPSSAQEPASTKEIHLSLELENADLLTVFNNIEQLTEFNFVYNSKDIDQRITLNNNYRNTSLYDILIDISKHTSLGFKRVNTNINVKKLPEGEPATVTEEIAAIPISGRVTSQTDGEGLPGVNVLVKGSSTGTITDVEGNYNINVPNENDILVFSSIGYITQEVPVNGRSVINIVLEEDVQSLEEIVVVGYGTQKKSDVTGATERVDAEDFQNQTLTQLTDMLTGTVAGFNVNQSPSAGGVGTMLVRGPTSLTAGTEPMIVVDGAIYKGSLQDINPYDIETIDVLKDASSAAVYGSKAASGVILVTTKKGKTGKPTINLTTRWGMVESTNKRRGLGPDEYIQFRQNYFRTTNPNMPYHFYTNPNELPNDISLEEWRGFSNSPLEDNEREYLSRLRFFPIEVENYLAGRTVDWYDVVMRQGLRQTHDLSIGGGTEDFRYYWSVGYTDNEGIIVGDEYSTIRSRLNVDFKINDWLDVGVKTQFSDQDESGISGSMGFYSNSPFGREFDEEGNLERMPHGHTDHPLLNYYRQDNLNKINTLFANMYANIDLPFGIEYTLSFQPRYESWEDFLFTTTDPRVGGVPSQDMSQGSRSEYSHYEWMIDNILKWNKEIGVHSFDVTLLQNVEETQRRSSYTSNLNFAPTELLGYHALQYGDAPSVSNNDYRYTGDALMARLNYTLFERYLLTASIRRDGYSAFGLENPRANFPALALGWIISEEKFFKPDLINWMKLRLSWGVNGNRDIGMYASIARLEPEIWYDGSNTRIGVYNSTLGNNDLRWERTESFNIGMDFGLLSDRINLSLDYYDMTTTDLLMNRQLPALTGFTSITSNLGELRNRGFEMSLDAVNIAQENLTWKSSLVFSLNRNKIISLFGDTGEYTLLGQTRTGEVPDYSNQWFPGQAIDVVWDYDITGVWQEEDLGEVEAYGMRVGDFKAVDLNEDGVYNELDDKQFIGYTQPRYRFGFRNDFTFLKNFTASVFVRADLGHIGEFSDALNPGWESNDRRNRNVGPVPYWTPENPINDYARLDVSTSGYGGDLRIFKPRSFVRIQDVTLGYSLPSFAAERLQLNNMRIFASVRNLITLTKWPGWDPETGGIPMLRSYNLGLSLSL